MLQQQKLKLQQQRAAETQAAAAASNRDPNYSSTQQQRLKLQQQPAAETQAAAAASSRDSSCSSRCTKFHKIFLFIIMLVHVLNVSISVAYDTKNKGVENCNKMTLLSSARALVATSKVATSLPQQTRDDVTGIISKSRHGDVAAILTTNKVTPYTIHRGAMANAFTEIRSISGRLPSLHPTPV